MSLFALFIGVILIVSAVRNSHGALFTAVGTDAPKFIVWAAAIVAIGAIGFIPGLKPVSRLLLALIIIVLLVNNYEKLVKGFQNAWQNPGDTASQKSHGNEAETSSDLFSKFWNYDLFGDIGNFLNSH